MSIVGSPVRVGVRARRWCNSAALGVRACRCRAIDAGRRGRDEVGVTRAVMGIVGIPVRVGVRTRWRCDSAALIGSAFGGRAGNTTWCSRDKIVVIHAVIPIENPL